MDLPPVIARIREKAIPFNTIHELIETNPCRSDTFPVLSLRFVDSVSRASKRLLALPADHRYWQNAPRSQNFLDAVRAFLDDACSGNPDDVESCWGRVALAVASAMTPVLLQEHWASILIAEPSNVRWLMQSALWIRDNTGRDCREDIALVLAEAVRRDSSFKVRLSAKTDDPDPEVAQAARYVQGLLE